jgi:outer membrane protein TolC
MREQPGKRAIGQSGNRERPGMRAVGQSGSRGTAIVILLLCGLGLHRAAAQRMPDQLTLEEAQRLARLYNPEYKQAENDAGVAAAAVRARFGSFLPSLNSRLAFGGSLGWTQSTTQALDEYGRPISSSDSLSRVHTEKTPSSNASQGVSLGLTLFDGGANIRYLSAARAAQEETEARIANQSNALRAQVGREYFAAMRAHQAIGLEERLLAARKDDLQRTEKLLGVAASKYIDVLTARLQVAAAEQSLEQARGNAEKQRLTLKHTIGMEGAATFTLATEPPKVFDPATLAADALVSRALTASPTVLAARASLVTADRTAAAARGARLPQIGGSLNFGRTTSVSGGYGAIGQLDLPNRSLGFGIDVSLPLFSRFTTSSNIAQADANEQDRREALRRTRLTAENNVRTALIDLHNAYRTVQIRELTANLRREQLSMAQEEYRRGVTGMDFFRLQQIVSEEATAQRDLLDARFNFITAVITLEERLGSPLER